MMSPTFAGSRDRPDTKRMNRIFSSFVKDSRVDHSQFTRGSDGSTSRCLKQRTRDSLMEQTFNADLKLDKKKIIIKYHMERSRITCRVNKLRSLANFSVTAITPFDYLLSLAYKTFES